jgi:signal transduction histidine kinase
VALFFLYAPVVVVRPHPYSPSFIIRLVTVYLFITSVTFWFEFYRDQFRRELSEEQRQRQQRITADQQENEASLRLAHQQLLTILESIDAHVYVTEVSSHEILYMNQAMKDVFGSNREGELCYQAFRDGGAPREHCPIPRLLGTDGDAEGKSAWECFNPLSKRWYSNFDRLMLWPDGRQVKVQIAFDISDRKQWELEREAAEKALHDNQKTEALQRMAGVISHHFNNQLTHIIGNLQLALEAGSDETQVREYLQSAIHVAIDSSEISMLLSQYTGQRSAELQPIDVGEFCRRQRPLLEKLLPANILLETDGLTTGLCIHGDTVILEQILTQLVTNSRDAINGRGGRIGIFVTLMAGKDIAYRQCEPKNWRPSVSSYCCLSVKDSGVGISEDNKGRIFDPFFTTKQSSRGLGLAVVLAIVKASGGAVAVTSDVQRGCLVEVFLPLINTKESVA